ncbi:magnesium transporter [Alphaproteobacteria bacterium]|nr:magnesium transporter [Alphaproteobacteria bacterium]
MSSNQVDLPEGGNLGFEALTAEGLQELRDLMSAGDAKALFGKLEGLHESDIAEIISLLTPEQRLVFMGLVGADIPAAVFPELDEHIRPEIIEFVDLQKMVSTVQELDSDDAVFVLEDMDAEDREEILKNLPRLDRLVLERALDFPEDSAGRLMQSEFVAVPPFWSVGQTIDYLRSADDLPDDFLEIYITDPTYTPLGAVYLSRILRTDRAVEMAALMHDDLKLLQADTDREDVARLFERYHLVSAAVVDEDKRLLGVITPDDIFEVIAEEAGEDILLLGGVGDEAVTDSVYEAARGRLSWLFLNLLTAIAASVVIGLFDASIEKMVALAVLMPIVASMGGNAGTQTLTIAVRGLATQELQPANMLRVVYREIGVGLFNGVFFAIITGCVAAFWFDSTSLGVVLAAAMVVNLFVAALAGILIPIGLNRANIDPALASTVFVTTVTDVIGFLAFLSFATIFLV